MRPSLADVARDAADGMVDLVAAQIKLARLELAADARRAVQGVVKTALFSVPILAGYLFAVGAAASALSALWGWTIALVIVAGAQIVIGAVGIRWSLRTLGSVHVLHRSSAEAASTVQGALAAISSDPPANPANGALESTKSLTKSLTRDASRPSRGAQ